MKLKVLCATLAILTACKRPLTEDSVEDSSDTSPPDTEDPGLSPMVADTVNWCVWNAPRFPSGYSIANSRGGLLTTLPENDDGTVFRIPWDTASGCTIEDTAEVVASWPGGADALRTEGEWANLAFGVMGTGMATYWPAGVDGVTDASAADAPVRITGTVEGGYTGRVFIGDFDGDEIEDLAVVEGSVPGYVRIFSDASTLLGEYSADEANITIEACAESTGYGPTFVERFGDYVAVGCASRNYRSGLGYIYEMPITADSEPTSILTDFGGWYGSNAEETLYIDVRGGGALGILDSSGGGYYQPSDASARFGASPVVAEHEGRTYLAVGDQARPDGEGNLAGAVYVCDITDQKRPEEYAWFDDCITVTPPIESGIEYSGAALDLDSIDGVLYLSASAWQFGGVAADGVLWTTISR
jgi:hypothetical protein